MAVYDLSCASLDLLVTDDTDRIQPEIVRLI